MRSGTATKPTPPASAMAAVGVKTKGVAAAAAIIPAVLGMDITLDPNALMGDVGILKPLHDTSTTAINRMRNIRVIVSRKSIIGSSLEFFGCCYVSCREIQGYR